MAKYNTDLELISMVARKLQIPHEEAKEITQVVVDSLREYLIINCSMNLRRFGKFTLRGRKNSTVRNPRTGETKKLPLLYYIGFNAANSLKGEINSKARERMKQFRNVV